MIIHDYLTTVSCDCCSAEIQVERNLGESKMRRIARKAGWVFVNGGDICPACWKRKEPPKGESSVDETFTKPIQQRRKKDGEV